MFELTVKKNDILTPLLAVAGAVDKKQSMPILSNFLLRLEENQLIIMATDLEIEITARIICQSQSPASTITVPAKKFVDIIRSLDENAEPVLTSEKDTLIIKVGRSKFRLSTLPPDAFPTTKNQANEVELIMERAALLSLLQSTYFAMSQQDVRIYLNGLLLEFEAKHITAVASDGHRMAISRHPCENQTEQRYLLPRKGVHELLRILTSTEDEMIEISAGKTHFGVTTKQFTFVTQLVDARFPAYQKAVPQQADKSFTVDSDEFKRALSRIIILANEKLKSVMLHLQPSTIMMTSNNQSHEEAQESLEVQTEGDEMKIGINANYVLDVLNYFAHGKICFSMSSPDSSILIQPMANDAYQYILMPMKI